MIINFFLTLIKQIFIDHVKSLFNEYINLNCKVMHELNLVFINYDNFKTKIKLTHIKRVGKISLNKIKP